MLQDLDLLYGRGAVITSASHRLAGLVLTPAAVKTSAYNASPGDFVPCDTTSAAFTVTLPSAPADRTVVAVKMVTQGGTNAVTIAASGSDVFNKASGATSETLSTSEQAMTFQYLAASGIWYVTTADLILSQLDARYVRSGAASPVASTPTAPSSTVSTTLVMMGLGTNTTGTPWAFTPASSGNLLVTVTGLVAVASTVVNVVLGARYGTSTAPVNGAAVTGTRWGSAGDLTIQPKAVGVGVPFTFCTVLSLSKGTAYWFDLALDTSNASDAASVADVSFAAVETS